MNEARQRRRQQAAALVLIAALASSSCTRAVTASPTSPSTPSIPAGRLEIACASPIFVSEVSPCGVVWTEAGVSRDVSTAAILTSSRPAIVEVESAGFIAGRAAGDAVVTARYRDIEAAAPVMVQFIDGLRATSALERVDPRPGGTASIILAGFYSVATASTGRLELVISDQRGFAVAVAGQRTVSGAGRFSLSIDMRVPDGATRLCRAARLTVGSEVFSEPKPDNTPFSCIEIVR